MPNDREPSVFIISAPSGAGKTTVLARLLDRHDDLRFSVSHTTRAPRPGEVDGVAYHFTNKEDFLRMVDYGKLLEWAEVHGQLYGTSRSEVDRARAEGADLVLDIDVQGAAQVSSQIEGAVTIFILPPSYPVLETRLRGRGAAGEEDLQRRLRTAVREASRMGEYDYIVVNDDIETCVLEIEAIVKAARCRTSIRKRSVARILGTFPSQQGANETNA